MTRYPSYLEHKQVPDVDILKRIKVMMKNGKGPKQMHLELPEMSIYKLSRYYSKVRRGIW